MQEIVDDGPVALGSDRAAGLIDAIRKEIHVSADAGRVHLSQHMHVQTRDYGRSLFGYALSQLRARRAARRLAA
jgi:hypothetical protein